MKHSPRAAARHALALAIPLALAACYDTLPTSDEPATPHTRVVLVSVDGLRADAMAHMPRLSALAASGVSTDGMSTVLPSVTVPGHLSMLSGRDVTRYGITTNALDSTSAMRFAFSGSTTVFDWVRAAHRSSEAITGASLIGNAVVSDARDFFGVDSLVATDTRAEVIADRAVARLTAGNPPALLFVHFPDVDLAGHDAGWLVPGVASHAGGDSLAPSYLAAARRVDDAIGRLATLLRPALDSGNVVLVITADHGGGNGVGCVADVPAFREHCTGAPGDELIPFVAVSRGIAPQRLPAGTQVTQVGPTIGALLKVRVPSGTAERLRF
jgi:predicted AlkP superfamily pyrophosphatase or phosphodiesterase